MELTNKRIVFLGDSITEGVGTSSENKTYHQIIKEKYGLNLACNCGVGGTTIAKRRIPTYESTKCDFYFAFRAQLMPKDADIVVVFGETNDYGHDNGGELGDALSNDIYTFNGALNNLIKQLKKDYQLSKIVFLTPLHRVNENICVNNTGNILKDY